MADVNVEQKENNNSEINFVLITPLSDFKLEFVRLLEWQLSKCDVLCGMKGDVVTFLQVAALVH